MSALRSAVATAYVEAFKTASPRRDALAQFEALYPFLADLRDASGTRPYCRFQQDYRFPPYNLHLSLLTAQISVAKILAVHALLALEDHQSQLALDDLRLNFKLAAGLREEPILVSGLCAAGVEAIGRSVVADGLAMHAWNEGQLVELERELVQVDYLATYQLVLRGEAIGMTIPAFDSLKARRPTGYVSELNARNAGDESKHNASDGFRDLWADGWIDWMKVHAVDFDLNAVRLVDPENRMVDARPVDQLAAGIAQRQRGWSARTLWTILADEAAGPMVAAVQHFAEGQVYVDETRIACALERYRLAHGTYPASLDALVPACIDSVPHDIMNGEPYRYRLRPDGTFLLYSVGWNLTDDGGVTVFTDPDHSGHPRQDYGHGDWVWPTPK